MGGRAGPQKAFSHRPVSVHQEADFSYLPGDRKPPVLPHPSPPPLAHGEPVPPPPPPHLLEPPAVSASPGVSAGPRHSLHRTRRGGSHSSSSAQARFDRTHGARTAGRVASYYGGRFGPTSAPLPPAPSPQSPVPSPSAQQPDGAAAQARRRPGQNFLVFLISYGISQVRKLRC
nr:uncharacterized protein LOC131753537 [Kogia breviceps]